MWNLDEFEYYVAGIVPSTFYLIKKHRTSSRWVPPYWFGRKNEGSWVCECDIQTHRPKTCYNNSNSSTLMISIENFISLLYYNNNSDNFVQYKFEWNSLCLYFSIGFNTQITCCLSDSCDMSKNSICELLLNLIKVGFQLVYVFRLMKILIDFEFEFENTCNKEETTLK